MIIHLRGTISHFKAVARFGPRSLLLLLLLLLLCARDAQRRRACLRAEQSWAHLLLLAPLLRHCGRSEAALLRVRRCRRHKQRTGRLAEGWRHD